MGGRGWGIGLWGVEMVRGVTVWQRKTKLREPKQIYMNPEFNLKINPIEKLYIPLRLFSNGTLIPLTKFRLVDNSTAISSRYHASRAQKQRQSRFLPGVRYKTMLAK